MGTEKRARQKANRQTKFEEEARQYRRRSLTRRVVIGVVAAVVAVGVVIAIAQLSGIGDDDETAGSTLPAIEPTTVAEATTTPGSGAPGVFTYGSGECPPEEVTEPTRTFTDAPPQLCIDPARDYTATIRTSEGDITVDLDTADTPGTVNNFVTLARYGYYDDTKIFRAAEGIEIIQGGGQTNADTPGYEIPDEGADYTYEPGQIVMARRPQQPNSAGAQWFIVTGEAAANLNADGSYVVFGEITEGLDVAQAIQALGQPDETLSREVTVDTVDITEA